MRQMRTTAPDVWAIQLDTDRLADDWCTRCLAPSLLVLHYGTESQHGMSGDLLASTPGLPVGVGRTIVCADCGRQS
jgi:hypothetical protein